MATVLIVDDSAFMRTMIKTTLQNNGFQIVGEASDGAMGFEKYKELKPDIVTMDITMPVMTGIEAVKAIVDYDPKAKIIMISAMGQEALIKESISSGAKNFIVKPFKQDYFVDSIKKLL